jgi:hypothetical protein
MQNDDAGVICRVRSVVAHCWFFERSGGSNSLHFADRSASEGAGWDDALL